MGGEDVDYVGEGYGLEGEMLYGGVVKGYNEYWSE